VSAVLYTRVSEALKQALTVHAAGRGLSQTRALVELLEQGLAGNTAEFADELARSQGELAATRVRVRELDLALEAARAREEHTARTYAAFAARARQVLASCPRCTKPLRGSDLLVTGRCPHCDHAVTELLAPAPRSALNQTEYLALLGALGLLTGLALASAGEEAG
jgi:Zn finger protein HypA/HybF involved in hydrogenase expression